MKKKSLAVRIKQLSKKVVSLFNVVLCGFILSINSVYAQGSNTSSIDGFITFVCDWLLKIGGVVALIGAVMLPIGLSLLTLFFLLDVTKKVMDYERFSWERMVFTFIRFLIFKMLIENSFELLSSIMSISNNILTQVTSSLTSSSAIPNLATQMGDLVRNAGNIVE